MNWKDFFYFSRREKTGIIVFVFFIAGVFVGKYLFTPDPLPPVEEMPVEAIPAASRSVPPRASQDGQADSRHPGNYPKQNRSQSGNKPAGMKTYYPASQKEEFKQKQPLYPKTEKYPEGTVINLNLADTTELKKIPGIGSSYAKRICGYRKLLGGYHRLEQLQEVYGMYEELYEQIIPYFDIDTNELRKIQVNRASLDQLKAHPYLDFYQAKAIVEVRKKNGRIDAMQDLLLLEEFSSDDRERLAPYFSFE